MKTLALFSLLVVLVSCGGKKDSKTAEGPRLDPITQDKFEQYIMSLRPGMVTDQTSFGTELDYTSDINGNWAYRAVNANSLTKETILNISGDSIYTLFDENFEAENRPTKRKVKLESLTKLIREYTEALPPGFSIRITGDNLVVLGSSSMDWEFDQGTKIYQTAKINMSVNLTDIRCSQRSSSVITGKLVVNGRTSALPTTGTTDVGGCGTTLTAAQLRALDLTDMTFCDESTDGKAVSCNYNQDLSYLVQ